MDFLTFLSNAISALSWPITILVLVFMLKEPISEIISLLRKLKYKELEMEFSEQVSKLKIVASESDMSVNAITEVVQNEELRTLRLVTLSPRAAIMEAWIHVESAAMELVNSFYGKSSSNVLKNYPKLGEYDLPLK